MCQNFMLKRRIERCGGEEKEKEEEEEGEEEGKVNQKDFLRRVTKDLGDHKRSDALIREATQPQLQC